MFTNYFLEIKNRLFLVGFLWVTVFITCYHYKEVILFLLIYSNSKLYSLNSVYFIFTNITDLFSMYFILSYFVSNQIFVLVFSYHIVVFLSPGLFKFEYDLIKVGMFVCLCFYLTSICLLNNVVLPYLWEFFTSFHSGPSKDVLFFESKITEYLHFYIDTYLVTVFIGQFFAFIVLFLRSSDTKQYYKTRKFFYCGFVCFATLATPPDIISQICLSILFVVLYELFIVFVIFIKLYTLRK